ncbi:hypothetical protein B0H10DRAFT_1944024 [Mycena sp. CBHHK59/15]|nr:hypothetical protein B0H10DRAFT_1944024 [Mycena sp. CBHHK59/15]
MSPPETQVCAETTQRTNAGSNSGHEGPPSDEWPAQLCLLANVQAFLAARGQNYFANATFRVDFDMGRAISGGNTASVFCAPAQPNKSGRGFQSLRIASPYARWVSDEFQKVLNLISLVQHHGYAQDEENNTYPSVRRMCNEEAFTVGRPTYVRVDISNKHARASFLTDRGEAMYVSDEAQPLKLDDLVLIEATLHHTETREGRHERVYSVLAQHVKVLTIVDLVEPLVGLSRHENIDDFLHHPFPSPDDDVVTSPGSVAQDDDSLTSPSLTPPPSSQARVVGNKQTQRGEASPTQTPKRKHQLTPPTAPVHPRCSTRNRQASPVSPSPRKRRAKTIDTTYDGPAKRTRGSEAV